MGDEDDAQRDSDASPFPKRRTRHHYSRSSNAASNSSASNALLSTATSSSTNSFSNTTDVKPSNGSISISSTERQSLPTPLDITSPASAAAADSSVSSGISQVLTPTVSSGGTVTKTKSLLKARRAMSKMNLQASPVAGETAVEGGSDGSPPAPKLRPWNHMPPEVKQFTKFQPKPMYVHMCVHEHE